MKHSDLYFMTDDQMEAQRKEIADATDAILGLFEGKEREKKERNLIYVSCPKCHYIYHVDTSLLEDGFLTCKCGEEIEV